jgi:phosphohistidine phosphatase SixA
MRHGIAEPYSLRGDAGRKLTERGRDRVARASRLLASFVQAEAVWSSPYERAVATARIVAEALERPHRQDARLVPGSSLGDLADVLAEARTRGPKFVVTHQPNVGRWVRDLTGAEVAFAPGTVAALDVGRLREGGAVLLGLYDPHALDSIARLST